MESEETDPGLDLRVAWSRGRPVAFPGSPLSQAAASAGIAGLREDPLRRRACGWVGARVLHIPAGLELLNTVALGTGSHTSLALAQGQESRPAPQAPPSAGLPRSPFPQLHPPALPQTRSGRRGLFLPSTPRNLRILQNPLCQLRAVARVVRRPGTLFPAPPHFIWALGWWC